MPHFSERSRQRLLTCDARIITVLSDVIQHYDFSVTCGHRTDEEQARLYAQGRTEPGPIVTYAMPGESIHNTLPSRAVDVAPWPIDWDNKDRFVELAGAILYAARVRGVPLEWGGHWTRLRDLPHFQITE